MQFLKKECGGEGRGCCSEPVKMEFFRFACDYDEVENTIGVDVDANDVKEGSKNVIDASDDSEEEVAQEFDNGSLLVLVVTKSFEVLGEGQVISKSIEVLGGADSLSL